VVTSPERVAEPGEAPASAVLDWPGGKCRPHLPCCLKPFLVRDWLPNFVNAREKDRKYVFFIGMFCEKLSGIHINGLCFYALLSGRHYQRQFFVNIDREAEVFPFC
jgi:hypothetical protein